MTSLGFDMSTTSSGISVFNDDKLENYHCIKVDSKSYPNWRDRIKIMGSETNKIITSLKEKADIIYMEDVPIIRSKGLETLVILGAVQGLIIGVASSNNIDIQFIYPSTWRSILGLFDGTQEGTARDEMKRKSIEYCNLTFGLELVYKSKSSKFNQDDEADSINIAYSQIIKSKQTIKSKPNGFGTRR